MNIILPGDFNESIHSPEGISKQFSDLGCLNTTHLQRTHSRGSKAIDHIWTTKYLLDNIHRAGITPFGKFYDFDHGGIFVDISTNILLSEEKSKLIYHYSRRLKSCVPKRVKII